MSERIRVVALFNAKPNKIDELKATLKGFIEPTRKEEGCIFYELQQNKENPLDFVFVEEWKDELTLARHLESPHIREAGPKIGDLVTSPPDIRRYRLIA